MSLFMGPAWEPRPWVLTIVHSLSSAIRSHYARVAIFVGIALIFALGFREVDRLNRYRKFIEATYESELSLIEAAMEKGGSLSSTMTDVEFYEWSESTRQQVAAALSAPEISELLWSRDGHHGLEGVKTAPFGRISLRSLVRSVAADQAHFLRKARTENGVRLLAYDGWVRSAWKRHYTIFFLQPDVDARMISANKRMQVQQSSAK